MPAEPAIQVCPCLETAVFGHRDRACPQRPLPDPEPHTCEWMTLSAPPAARVCIHCGAWQWLPWPRPVPDLKPAVTPARSRFRVAAGVLAGRRASA